LSDKEYSTVAKHATQGDFDGAAHGYLAHEPQHLPQLVLTPTLC